MPRRVFSPFLGLLLALAALTPTFAAEPTPDGERRLPSGAEEAKVTEVVDGDTIKVRIDGETETVRLIGIDTPETVDPDEDVQCFGPEASDHAERLLDGRTVWLETDVSDDDQYDRLLRYVWFKGKSDNRYYLANEVLVRRGYAVVSTVPPDVEHVERLTAAQGAATDEGIGRWRSCDGADAPAGSSASAGDGTSADPDESVAPALDPVLTDCGAFGSFDEANAYYAGRPDSQPYLDPNVDGRACEVWFAVDAPAAGPAQGIVANPGGGCDPSYPTLCIPVGSPDLDCAQVGASFFTVLPPDPHGFDREGDGIGCES